MKETIKYIILTAAVGAVLASCQREQLPGTSTATSTATSTGTSTGASDGLRVISVDFADGTKTSLDGIHVKFCEGDIILVSNVQENGEGELEDCQVKLDAEGNAQITTTLQGKLKAVYPVEAAVLDGYDIDLDTIRVPDVQSGRFEDANICTSTIAADGSSAIFTNRTAILKFYVEKSIGVTSIKVTSSGADIADGSKTINVTAPSGKTLDQITDDPRKRICYVAVRPGVTADQLTFTTSATTQLTLPHTPTNAVALSAGTLYRAFIPYYIDFGTDNKWGYCNIGAFLPEDYGNLYSWGNPTGQSGNGTFNPQFTSAGYPAPGKNIGNAAGWARATHDAAYNDAKWGHNWCLPAEFTSLAADGVWIWTSDYKGTGVAGYTVYVAKDNGDKGKAQINNVWKKWDGSQYADSSATAGTYDATSDIHVFLPVAGYSVGTKRDNGGAIGYYWSSAFTSDSNPCITLHLKNDILNPKSNDTRYHGRSIRPILNEHHLFENIEDGGTI